MFVMLQTILRMHEREEKMKERLMDLRLKSEEQVLKILKTLKILKILKNSQNTQNTQNSQNSQN